MAYDIDSDAELNKFETDDLKDITKAGLGTAGREVVVNVDFLVFLGIVLIILGAIGGIIAYGKGWFKRKN